MSYLVLARKYRPKNFTEMVGQEHVVQALTNALTQQRLHHAYLFTGTRGVGKTTVSRILAKSLNCEQGITAQPCGVCQACTDIDSGRFVDYTELDAASNRGVDEVQQLLEQAVYKPVQGRFKVFMIDEVHMLTNTAFNAMLKTLEEPPEYLKFVLATTDPQKVPVTVLSRCLQFNLRPMAPETVLDHLTQVLQAESVAADVQALRLLARAARGSMRDALSLTDQAIAFGGGQLQEANVRQMLGSVDRAHVFALIDALAAGDGRTVVETCEALRVQGLSAATTLEDMSMVLQRMAVVQAVPGMSDAAATDPDAERTAALALRMPADETQLLYSLCLQGRQELGLAPDEYAGLTMVLLRLLAFKAPAAAATAPAEKKTLLTEPPRSERPAALHAAPATPPPVPVKPTPVATPPAAAGMRLPVRDMQAPSREAAVPAASPPADAPQAVLAVPVRQPAQNPGPAATAAPGASTVPEVVPTEEGDHWQQCVQQLVANDAIQSLTRELALQSQLVARDEGNWLIRVERESLNNPNSRERLQKALATLGQEVTLTVELGRITDSPARRAAAAAAERQLAAEAVILNDPYVQQLVQNFGAKIVPGSIKPI
jgi:DNA polymerase-3 subunit gamma/tau